MENVEKSSNIVNDNEVGFGLRIIEKYSPYNFYCEQFGRVKILKTDDGAKNYFFTDHYYNVYKNRSDEDRKTHNIQIFDHPYVGKEIKFTCRKEHRKSYVQSIHKHFNLGYYLVMLYYTVMNNGCHSHGTMIFENINSIDPFTIKTIEEHKTEFEIVM